MDDHSVTYRQFRLRHLPHMVRRRKMMRLLERELDRDRHRSFCDVGCSNGYLTDAIARRFQLREAAGKDHGRENLAIAAERYPHIRFGYLDLNAGTKPSEAFDFVTCFETLEHVGNIDNAVGGLVALTRAGGVLVISVPVETGVIGLIKFVLKVWMYGDGLDEVRVGRWRYLRALLRGERLSTLRRASPSYAGHFGFDFRDVEDRLARAAVTYRSFTSGTTRFYVVRRS